MPVSTTNVSVFLLRVVRLVVSDRSGLFLHGVCAPFTEAGHVLGAGLFGRRAGFFLALVLAQLSAMPAGKRGASSPRGSGVPGNALWCQAWRQQSHRDRVLLCAGAQS